MGLSELLKKYKRVIFSGEKILVEEKSIVCENCVFVSQGDVCKGKFSCIEREVKFIEVKL